MSGEWFLFAKVYYGYAYYFLLLTLAKRKEQPWNFSAMTSELVRSSRQASPPPPPEIASSFGMTPPSDFSRWAGRMDLSSVSQLAWWG